MHLISVSDLIPPLTEERLIPQVFEVSMVFFGSSHLLDHLFKLMKLLFGISLAG